MHFFHVILFIICYFVNLSNCRVPSLCVSDSKYFITFLRKNKTFTLLFFDARKKKQYCFILFFFAHNNIKEVKYVFVWLKTHT